MAASSSDQSDEIYRSIFQGTNLHRFTYIFNELTPRVKQQWTFREDFDTECQVLPTSWFCEILYQKVADVDTVSVPFALKRTDSASSSVNVRVFPFIYDDAGKYFCLSQKIEREGIHAGDVIELSLTKHFRYAGKKSYANFTPFVYLIIEVISCHSTGMHQE
ncbi:hypothetical protein AVEN_171327-1 [Araneus ventricosus]|uniref:Uncharacterized protein n=1 Tax=Araneus ventricosus TaxID=182803 RepID=A0A4Y2M7R7_ARAVE|nr:hypothetical protein AVEN_171327-1 [Araneus ventricosus]